MTTLDETTKNDKKRETGPCFFLRVPDQGIWWPREDGESIEYREHSGSLWGQNNLLGPLGSKYSGRALDSILGTSGFGTA